MPHDPEKERAYGKAYREANKEKIKAKNKAYYEAKKGEIRVQQKAYYEANKDKIKAHKKANKDKKKAYDKIYYEANKNEIRAQHEAWRKANKDQIRAWREANKGKTKAYYEVNKDRYSAYSAKRKALKIPALLPTTNNELIKKLYKQREQMSEKHGEQYHVDHIIPLSIGGAHHQDNMRVITAKENLEKKDKYIPELGGVWADNDLARETKKKLGIK